MAKPQKPQRKTDSNERTYEDNAGQRPPTQRKKKPSRARPRLFK